MSEREPPESGDKERLEQLEAEVVRLRRELASREGTELPGGSAGPAGGANASLGGETQPFSDDELRHVAPSRSRGRAIAIASFLAVLALAAIIGLTSLLTRGFDSFANQTARMMAPDEPDPDSARPKSDRGGDERRSPAGGTRGPEKSPGDQDGQEKDGELPLKIRPPGF